ncbi:aerobic cobaltochelatase CobT subunit [Veronia nyctiphanis]|uniref:Aerobic cobaltochelatase CobT subunit n=1 Tax=Veronia nyctiphanis TaxID=1278244 RepID=A0A4Q0YJ06_9GAMM|nr:aerobic cobaltochelatase CobT subunit [Veronia nyctiphanis]RXJ69099.1 aerobic cobaltochelatase CobT subunit [Veronia nyctiphanis]
MIEERAHLPLIPYSRHAQRCAELDIATLRALTGDKELLFKRNQLFKQRKFVPTTSGHVARWSQTDSGVLRRGRIDAIASRYIYSDGSIHEALRPDDPIGSYIFDLLEQFRCEQHYIALYPGTADCLRTRFIAWSDFIVASGDDESAIGILLLTVIHITRSKVSSESVPASITERIEATRAAISPFLGHHLVLLKRYLTEQQDYARHAKAIAVFVSESISHASDSDDSDDVERNRALKALAMFASFYDEEDAVFTVNTDAQSRRSYAGGYDIFTDEFDQEIEASSLVRVQQLNEFRATIDSMFSQVSVNLRALSRQMAKALNGPHLDGSEFNQEQGFIDGRKLSQIVASPSNNRVFFTEKQTLNADVQFSILMDCSGSMRNHIHDVAVLVDTLTRIAELAGAKTEVLGFTTSSWNGGKAYQKWLATGRPTHPGRLADVRHLVFKRARETWRDARHNIAALLKGDIYKEGIDGEALAWAVSRFRQSKRRHCLVVISDGCPMEAATTLANHESYLDEHLIGVADTLSYENNTALVGVGLGLDLSHYYRYSLAIGGKLTLSNQVLLELINVIAKSYHSQR